MEAPVDGSVSDVGDLIELVESVHDLASEEVGGQFAAEVLFEFLDDVAAGFLEGFASDGAFFAGLEHSVEEFMAGEGFAPAVAFNDPEICAFDFFVSGEAGFASDALPAATDASSVLGESGIDDFVL